MMRKKETYTIVTPIPSCVPRQLAIDILHSHSEIITLNPLVLSHRPIKAPRDAAADEYYSTWYEITERVQYVPGIGKMGSGKIKFKGCFHNVSWGLQTHMYAPMGIDLQSKWRIGGNQPDEPPELQESHLGNAPKNGLYLRENIEIECNITLMSFVKNQLKASSKVLVDRLIKKAELLDAGVLQAMMEDGKLRTFNPADRSSRISLQSPSRSLSLQQGQMSPTLPYNVPTSPTDCVRLSSVPEKSFLPFNYGQECSKGVAVELPADSYYPNLLESKKWHELSDVDSGRHFKSRTLSSSHRDSNTTTGLLSSRSDEKYPAELSTRKENNRYHN
ncbi:hypothetical protein P175DRAFT_0490711 [Aspergillus ochraceoroseus IBT 24754]|uniref:DUF7053 domain-containing protein n=3 Tax=Aspergillus subgen. Nidulantes TaxID=2720870 RepID=A0A0F8UQF9_9EURO|nr:uncharacterized protein P175DRAFT_0490711 [Aspergillus ochraceoroseus IBT 24754]KKK13081.1 hypothetical protein ARAM_007509 [Aspergillus rambellii]KKK20702.1 hypothetical protein AOCH_005467 [Aspergillus ochraceoroseus]PTU25687.1 hypothetical protein P175DRAFT_0490711 [Aspergillus ochraceoroseus IBT 24754]